MYQRKEENQAVKHLSQEVGKRTPNINPKKVEDSSNKNKYSKMRIDIAPKSFFYD